MKEVKVSKFEDLKVGDFAEVIRTISEDDIQKFGELSGDLNPLHFNEEWAKTTRFNGRIAHGALIAAFISQAIGMKLPGPGILYLGQQLSFRAPVRIGDTITVRASVIEKIDETRRVRIDTTCTNQDGQNVVLGEALISFKLFE
ncbi:MAG: MaoC family dehydratase [Candidatus Thorarchaeota archaeon]|nr:MaoC family dehydratase [Candidatus Thorarchaeota archaeon]